MSQNFATSSRYNRQDAAAYAAYMIGSSLFYSCRCRNAGEASRLYLHYTEMPQKKQYSLEDNIIRQEKLLGERFQQELATMASEARFCRKGDDYEVAFLTGGFPSVAFLINTEGKVFLTGFAG